MTSRGRRMAVAGVHPRLARALIDLGPRAAEVVALLSEQLPREMGDDLVEVWRAARRGDDAFTARWRREARRLTRSGDGPRTSTRLSDDELAGVAVALAFPERVARRRGGGYLMASGTEAQLTEGSRLADRAVAGRRGRRPAHRLGLGAHPPGGGHRRGDRPAGTPGDDRGGGRLEGATRRPARGRVRPGGRAARRDRAVLHAAARTPTCAQPCCTACARRTY